VFPGFAVFDCVAADTADTADTAGQVVFDITLEITQRSVESR
jgi:hypothetical protein